MAQDVEQNPFATPLQAPFAHFWKKGKEVFKSIKFLFIFGNLNLLSMNRAKQG